ncbi:PAS domain-containing protein [Streptomyces aurantiogriseus]|uniref:Nickel transporter n=1 Tax=Streptomyces aurantiogriseus TaxID=66870 RepID=A0A918BUW3_9ACTN|nr:PAS domain-containing protein [Streptomyces aurantiogriseus]GGQ93874.1 nickel transporter [Streptomyces aurantiogriseus]
MSSRPSRGAARLAAILDALPDALVLVNANGTVVNANTIALEAFEAPGTALVGRGLLDLLPHFDSKLIPGSMRRPDHIDPRGRTKPTRMIARRTDGSEFPVEVTSANLENGQQAYDSHGYANDELLMLVVRDLSGTVDTEAELARSQRQTEMILRAAAEGVVGTDTDGRIVLVNPAAAQILGYRASDLGGKELHTLVLHSRADGAPFPYDESPLADTLRSGRKHRVRGQVLWSKSGDKVSVDLTTAPVRDGDQLVGAVMTFTDRRPFDALAEEKSTLEQKHAEELERLSEEHASDLTALRQQHVTELEELRERHAEELAAGEDRYAALGEREKDRYEALAARHEQLLTLLGRSLRGPLDELRRELSTLAADDAGQLWPEANQVLHHLSAGYARITTLIDNVLGYQRLDTGSEDISRTKVMLDAVVAAGVDGAVELVGPGRVQFAVHAPPIEAEVDARLLATALAHLVADVAGVDATGNAPVSAGGYMDNTVVVAAAQRGEVVRIEVRGPYAGGDPVHEPIVRGIVRAHGGVLQTHEVPGMSGSAYVLEVPLGGGAGAVAAAPVAGVGSAVALPAGSEGGAPQATEAPEAAEGDAGAAEQSSGAGRRRARRSSVDAFLESEVPGAGPAEGAEGEAAAPTGRRRRRAPAAEEAPVPASADDAEAASGGTGRRRGRSAEQAGADSGASPGAGVAEGSVVTAAEHAAGTAASGTGLGGTVPPQGVPAPGGRRARRAADEPQALPAALPAGEGTVPAEDAQPTGRRRRALAAATERAAAQEATPRTVFALPPAEADRASDGTDEVAEAQAVGQVPAAGLPVPGQQGPGGSPVAGQQVPVPVPGQPVPVPGQAPVPGAPVPIPGQAVPVPGQASAPGQPVPIPGQASAPGQPVPVPGQAPVAGQAPVPAQAQVPVQGASEDAPIDHGRHDAVPHDQADDHTPPQPHPTSAPTGRRRRAVAQPTAEAAGVASPLPPGAVPAQAQGHDNAGQAVPAPGQAAPQQPGQAVVVPSQGQQPIAAAQPGATVQQPGEVVATAQGGSGQGGQAGPAQSVAGQPVPVQPVPAQSGPGQPLPVQPLPAQAPPGQPAAGQPVPGQSIPGQSVQSVPGQPVAAQPTLDQVPPGQQAAAGDLSPNASGQVGVPSQAPQAPQLPQTAEPTPAQPQPLPAEAASSPAPATPTPGTGTPLPPEATAQPRTAQPLPAEAAPAPMDPNSTQGRAISVRTLGQGVPFTRQAAQVQQVQQAAQSTATPAPHTSGGSGRRRKLGTRPDPAERPEQAARPHPTAEQPAVPQVSVPQAPPAPAPQPAVPHPSLAGQPLPGQAQVAPGTEGVGRSYAIGAPDENAAEGPEPLDGPGGAVEVADPPRPQPMDDELPPEPLDNPRRLLVWPAPDVSTQQALSDRGYRPVIVHSREEVDAQIAAFPAALFVDPLTGPITRTALQSLRQAAVAAEVPVLVTAGLGQATREAAYGADPAVLLKALAPRDSEQHPPRVLLIEEHAEIALALTATLERRGMQVARAASDADAVTLASQLRPNLVVMDLLQVHRGRAGIIDWLRANQQLNRTPLVVYTAAVDQADLPRLASGETVLFLAERSTSAEVQSRIVDLLARIGTN